jgi:hypothetical protein
MGVLNGGICQPKDWIGRHSSSFATSLNDAASSGAALSSRRRSRKVHRQSQKNRK